MILGSLVASLICVMLVPVDVFALTYAKTETALLRQLYECTSLVARLLLPCLSACLSSSQCLHCLSAVSFVCLAVLAFLIIPFTYFYTEDAGHDDDDEEPTCWERTWTAAKYTSLSVIIVLVIIVVGLVSHC